MQVIVNKNKKSTRYNEVKTDTWALPGGHLEFGETLEACARRETEEETGLILDKVKFWTLNESVMADVKRHYITIFMICSLVSNM